MTKDWFEMTSLRRKSFETSVWIPLFEMSYIEQSGKHGFAGYKEEFFGVGAVLIPTDQFDRIDKLNWSNVGIGHDTRVGVEDDGRYNQCDLLDENWYGIKGIFPVLRQSINSDIPRIWYLHQDLLVGLELIREGDSWLAPNEDYLEVVRLHRNQEGLPRLIEIRNDFLKDYLCARQMGLFMTTYRNRDVIIDEVPDFQWDRSFTQIEENGFRWEGRIMELHEGGEPFGSSAAVFHVSRTDIDPDEDVPVLGRPTDENTESSSWVKTYEGKKLYRIEGELWKDELILPGNVSERIKGDKCENPPFFYTDANGKKESESTLIDEGRWLWFDAQVMNVLFQKKSGGIFWFTRDTGAVKCSSDYPVIFGINKIGLITVYAKDIAQLPIWQQNIWVGFNRRPEGGISEELHMSQIKAQPASTQAPEKYIQIGIDKINEHCSRRFDFSLFRDHKDIMEIVRTIHRFRSYDDEGFFSLAKDIARITADAINTKELQSVIVIPKDIKWGSLKTLENFLVQKYHISPDDGKTLLGPLIGIYELRHSSAHLSSSELSESYKLVRIVETEKPIFKGFQMIHVFVGTLFKICKIMEEYVETPST